MRRRGTAAGHGTGAAQPVRSSTYTGLHAAAWQGDAARVERARGRPRPERARRPRAHAAARGDLRATARGDPRVGAAGADLGALDNDRYDAVTIAAVADDEETLRVLLSLGASAKLVTSRYDGTALIAAAHLGHDGVVRQLIAAGAPLDHVNNLHWTALIESIVLGNGGPRHMATLQALVDAGANTQLADRSGATPLALARARGFEPMVQILLRAAPGDQRRRHSSRLTFTLRETEFAHGCELHPSVLEQMMNVHPPGDRTGRPGRCCRAARRARKIPNCWENATS